MKQFLNTLVIFLIGFGVFVLVPCALIAGRDNDDRHSSSNSNIVSLQTKSQYDSLDVLFVGNSYCYSSIDPSQMDSAGINSYSLGIATAGVDFYELMINDYLSNVDGLPGEVFILVNPMFFSSKSDNFDLYPIHRYLEDPRSNLSVAFEFGRQEELLSMYRKSIKKGYTSLTSKRTERIRKASIGETRGFVASEAVVSQRIIEAEDHLFKPLLNEKFDRSKYTRLLELAGTLKGKGINVTFFELPTYGLRRYFDSSYMDAYEQVLVELDDHDRLIRLDSSQFAPSNYRSIDHMNTSGARIATRELIRYLSSDRRRTDS